MVTYRVKFKIFYLAIILFSVFGWVGISRAATYYVNGASGNDANSGSVASPWKTIDKANKTLTFGDTVYIRAGTYNIGNEVANGGSVNSQGIRPSNSGKPGQPITYSAYPGEIVNFVGISDGTGLRADAIYLDGMSYIHITGNTSYNMTFVNMTMNVKIGYNTAGYYNEIDHCDFGTFNGYPTWDSNWVNFKSIMIGHGSQFNYLHDNTIHDWQYYDATMDGPVCLEVGEEEGTSITYYNVVDNNLLYHCGHHVAGIYGKYTVVRNNLFHNENYWNSGGTLYGYRNLYTNGDGNMVLEGNRIGPSGISMLSLTSSFQRGGTSTYLNSSYNLMRYNFVFGALGMALNFRSYDNRSVSYNHVYNNTFFQDGYSTEPDIPCGERFPAHFTDTTPLEIGNQVKNNLFNYNWPQTSLGTIISSGQAGQTGCGTKPIGNDFMYENGGSQYQTTTNNLESAAAPTSLFINPDMTNAMSTTLPNLSLLPGTAPIDAGTYLTQATGAGTNSTTLVVGDAWYFQDGRFGIGVTWPSNITTIYADWICIGTVTNCVQISSINYSTNTITLSSPMTWSDKANIYLYKKSDGSLVLYGNVPDCGAYEYVTGTYYIGGTISGLTGTVVLQNNGGDNLSRSANGPFTFATALNNGATYSVTVSSQPSGQTCSVSNGSGAVNAANVTNVSITCAATAAAKPSVPTGLTVK